MSVLIRRSDAIAIIQNADYKYPTWPHIVEAKEGMVQAIKSAPTIDAVPVVRCGECDRRIKSADLTNTVLCGWLHKITMNKDDFCSYGAKMEDKPCG